MYRLFDYQSRICDEAEDYFSHGGSRLLIQAPTGSGKSIMMCDIIRRVLGNDSSRRVYFVTHSRGLLSQFSDHLTGIGMMHGIVASGCPTLGYRVQVISAQSLRKRYRMLAEPYLLIFEEAHHSVASEFREILDYWPHARLAGFTATPARPDGKPLTMYDKLIVSPSVRWFIDNYFLSDFDYYIPAEFDTSGIHHVAGEFSGRELAERAEGDKTRVGNLVEYYRKYADGKPGIAFCTGIADSDGIAERFRDSGYNMKSVHSRMTDSLDDVLASCRDGRQPLISSCDMIGEGIDVKGLTVMIDARPTESTVVEMQHWGRVLRAKYADGYDLGTADGRRAAMEAGGKGRAIILDFSSNYIRHGLPDDEREWSLDAKPKAKCASALKRCPDCMRPVPVSTRTCPYCGHVFALTVDTAGEETPERDGELVPITSVTYADRQALTLEIARHAHSMKQAIAIAESHGVNHQAAWFIWRKVLRQEGRV